MLSAQEDHRSRFYEHYRKESEEYDEEFLTKYDEDLNTTLIFVSFIRDSRRTGAYDGDRLVCSPPSPPRSSSRSIPTSSRTRTTKRQLSSVFLYTKSTTLPSATTLPPYRNGMALPTR